MTYIPVAVCRERSPGTLNLRAVWTEDRWLAGGSKHGRRWVRLGKLNTEALGLFGRWETAIIITSTDIWEAIDYDNKLNRNIFFAHDHDINEPTLKKSILSF
jgi:hypothetical protein